MFKAPASGSNNYPASCLAILTATPSSTDGIYMIDPDGTGPSPGLNVYCDMTNGGWTLIAGSDGSTAAGPGSDQIR